MLVAGQSKYQQILLWMRSQIETGTWPAHFQLKSEPELAEELNVARGTVQKAIAGLVAQRRLYRVRGKGTFVSATVLEPPLAQSLVSLSEALDLQGVTARTFVVAGEVVPSAPDWAQAALGMTGDSPAFCLSRIKALPDGPIAVLENYLNPEYFPGIQRVDFTTRRLFDVVEQDYGYAIDWGSRVFDISEAGALLGSYLEVPATTALMRLQQVTYTVGNLPIECSRVWIRSDRVRISTVIRRDHG